MECGRSFGSMKPTDNSLKKATVFMARFLVVGTLLLLSGCAGIREPGKPLRTAIEQLLLSQALERTLDNVSLPLPSHAAILVEAAGLTRDYAPDQEYARQAIAGHLTRQGFRLVQSEEEATYRVRVLLQTFGTERGIVFLGTPSVQSVLLPLPIPEIALYKDVKEKGYVRWSLNVFERARGALISSSPWYAASTFYSEYTVLFFVTFRLTDLELQE